MFKINIITQLLSFFIFAIIVNQLNSQELLILFTILIIVIVVRKLFQFVRSIKRFKWLFLVMMIVFAFNTPGEHVAKWPFSTNFSYLIPTYEGIIAGITQMLRIAVMLAALSLILAANTRQQLISGFYFLLSPLKYFGFEVERFAARLWLTLHYVEQQRDNNAKQDFFSRLKEMTNLKSNQKNDDVAITFKVPQFGVLDCVVVALLIVFSIFKVIS